MLFYTNFAVVGVKTPIAKKYNQAVNDHKEQLASMAFDRTLESAMSDVKGRNAKVIEALLDVDALKASKNQEPTSNN